MCSTGWEEFVCDHAFYYLCPMISHTLSLEDLSQFLEGDCCYAGNYHGWRWSPHNHAVHSNIWVQPWCTCWCCTQLNLGILKQRIPTHPVIWTAWLRNGDKPSVLKQQEDLLKVKSPGLPCYRRQWIWESKKQSSGVLIHRQLWSALILCKRICCIKQALLYKLLQ